MPSVNQRNCTLRRPIHILQLHISIGRGTLKNGRGPRKEIDDVEGDIKIRQVHVTGTLRTGMLSFISHLPDERGTPSHVPYTHLIIQQKK